MFDKERINEIATVSKEERWEYPSRVLKKSQIYRNLRASQI
jgi:hypothetical protein